MSKYKVLESGQRRMYSVMGAKEKFFTKSSKEDYESQLGLDKERVIVLYGPNQKKADLIDYAFAPAGNDGGYYSQGDYEGGRTFLNQFKTEKMWEKAISYNELKGSRYYHEANFMYVTDDKKVCGLSIMCFMEEPPRFAISHIENANAALMEDRKCTVIYDDALLSLFERHIDENAKALYADDTQVSSEKNDLTSCFVSESDLQKTLLALLQSETAKLIVGSMFAGESLNPYMVEYFDKLMIVQRIIKLAGLSIEDEKSLLAEACQEPQNYFEDNNFKCNLIEIINKSTSVNKRDAQLEYLSIFADEHNIDINAILGGISDDESISERIFNYLNSINKDSEPRNYNKCSILYLASITLSTDSKSRSEQKRIFTKISKISNNLDRDFNTELKQLASVKTDIRGALDLAIQSGGELNFDPQGRVLVELENSVVSLDVSGDVSGDGTLQSKFDAKILSVLNGDNSYNSKAILEKYKSLKSKNSIIFLQQEMHFHLSLALRLYQNQYSEINNEDFKKIHDATMRQVNDMVMQVFAQGLAEATENGTQELNVKTLNKTLAQGRKSIISNAHDFLLNHVTQEKPLIDLAEFDKSKAIKEAQHTTATNKRILHQDLQLANITEIGASEITSHVREKEKFAHRQIKRFRCDKFGNATYMLTGNKVRTPSLPVKKGLGSEQEYISDASSKISSLAKTYDFKEPFTYNLLTAMKHFLGDRKGNLQTQSARHIILGAHKYNREGNEPLCLVEAISVNGFGRPLGYNSYRRGLLPLADEATLLSEMALCFNIEREKDFLSNYEEFLKTTPPQGFFAKIGFYLTGGTQYFVKSKHGQSMQKEIAGKKVSWRKVIEVDKDDYVGLARVSLQKIMSYDLHFSHEYAKIIQSLSLFVEEEAVFGCKSGNERTPIIDERGQLLERPDLPIDLINKFNNLAKAEDKNQIRTASAELKAAIDKLYDDENIYGATALIPLVDQGGGHKIKPSQGDYDLNTNNAEEQSICNLVQSNASEMQAHKDLPKFMSDAIARRQQELSMIEAKDTKITTTETKKPSCTYSSILADERLGKPLDKSSKSSNALDTSQVYTVVEHVEHVEHVEPVEHVEHVEPDNNEIDDIDSSIRKGL